MDIQQIRVKLESNEELIAVMKADNTRQAMRDKFDKVVDTLLLDFVHTKLDLYKKLTNPKVNTLFKHRWFEGYEQDFSGP